MAHLLASVEELALALDLVFDPVNDGAKAVDVLQLHLGAQFRVAYGPQANVGFAAHVAFVHIRAAHAQVAQGLLELGQVEARFLRRADVRLRHDLHEGHAGAVHVEKAVLLAGLVTVAAASGVLLEMDAGNADALGLAVEVDFQPTFLAEGQIELGDLVALQQIGVVVVLAVELGLLRDGAVQGETGHDREFDSLLVDHR